MLPSQGDEEYSVLAHWTRNFPRLFILRTMVLFLVLNLLSGILIITSYVFEIETEVAESHLAHLLHMDGIKVSTSSESQLKSAVALILFQCPALLRRTSQRPLRPLPFLF